jgi:hypothetical protein
MKLLGICFVHSGSILYSILRLEMANRKSCRRNRKSSRRNRKSSRRNRRQNGGAYNPANLSLEQGKQFQEAHRLQHGGGNLNWAPVVAGDQGMLPADMREQARVIETFNAVNEASVMRDSDQVPVQAGGRRRGSRRSRRGSRRNNNGGMNMSANTNMTPSMRRRRSSRRGSRRNNNGGMNMSANTNMTPSMRRRRSSRRGSRRNNNGGMNMSANTNMTPSMRRRRRKQRGGLRVLEGASYDSPNMLLSPSEAAKAGTADFSNL